MRRRGSSGTHITHVVVDLIAGIIMKCSMEVADLALGIADVFAAMAKLQHESFINQWWLLAFTSSQNNLKSGSKHD